MDIRELTRQAQNMMHCGYGFRNENLYGAKVRDVSKVIQYEVEELGNIDIFLKW